MNYDIFEISLLAISMNQPEFMGRVNRELIEREDILELFEVADNVYKENKSSISVTTLRSKTSIDPYLLESLNMELLCINSLSEEKLSEVFLNHTKHLTDRKNTREMIKHSDNIRRLAQSGQLTAAVSYAKGIHFFDNEPLRSTSDLLYEALFESSGFKTGIGAIDDGMGGLLLGNMLSIIGDSGSMKTMVSLWLTLQVLKNNQTYTAMYFEKEMPVKDIARRLISYMLSINTQEIMRIANATKTGEGAGETEQLMLKMNRALGTEENEILKRLIIVPADKFNTAGDMHALIDQYRPQIWVLDYFTMLGDEGGRTADLYPFFYNTMDTLKRIVQSTNSLGIILAQLKQGTVRSRPNKLPTPADVEFGSKLHQYSAYMFATFNPIYYYDAEGVGEGFQDRFYLYGLKNRHESPPIITLQASPKICKFVETVGERRRLDLDWIGTYLSQRKDR